MKKKLIGVTAGICVASAMFYGVSRYHQQQQASPSYTISVASSTTASPQASSSSASIASSDTTLLQQFFTAYLDGSQQSMREYEALKDVIASSIYEEFYKDKQERQKVNTLENHVKTVRIFQDTVQPTNYFVTVEQEFKTPTTEPKRWVLSYYVSVNDGVIRSILATSNEEE